MTLNKTSLSLQNNALTLDVATKLFKSLIDFLDNVRNQFDRYECEAKEKFPEANFKDKIHRKVVRSSRLTFFDGAADTVQLVGKEKF